MEASTGGLERDPEAPSSASEALVRGPPTRCLNKRAHARLQTLLTTNTPQRWVTPTHKCWRTLFRGATVSAEPIPQSTKRDVEPTTTNEPPADNARYTVDREEVDRLRKRFMKLDKVRLPSSSKTNPIPTTQPSDFPLTNPPTGRLRHNRARRIPATPPSLLQPSGDTHDRDLR